MHVATPITKQRFHQLPTSFEEPERLSAKKRPQREITATATLCPCTDHEKPQGVHCTEERPQNQSEQTAPNPEHDNPSTPPKAPQTNPPRSANRTTPKHIPRTPASARTPEQRAKVAEEKEFTSVKVALSFDDEEEQHSSQSENVDNFIQNDVSDEMLLKNTEEKKERLSQSKPEDEGSAATAEHNQTNGIGEKDTSVQRQQNEESKASGKKRGRKEEEKEVGQDENESTKKAKQ